MDLLYYILAGIGISVGSYIIYKAVDQVLLPRSREFLLKRKTKNVLKQNKLMQIYVDASTFSQLLKQETKQDPDEEVRSIWREITKMRSIIDDKAGLKNLIDLMSTGIILCEKTKQMKYLNSFVKFAENHIFGNQWQRYSILLMLNTILKNVRYLTQQALRILIVEVEKGSVIN